ncbi:hypothetical protein B0T14DRAFT_566991 [Immersiella caudata]|uniref:Uncharacterized protein n=1 Tax=Immersiella caudata TaxID=314043 RepID=A0AA39WRG0_9PEZI|nr:hypothetical protein B0T14DRAFT_566991 [Immersiella caudata]
MARKRLGSRARLAKRARQAVKATKPAASTSASTSDPSGASANNIANLLNSNPAGVKRLEAKIRGLQRQRMALRKKARHLQATLTRRTVESFQVVATLNNTLQDKDRCIEALESTVSNVIRVVNDLVNQPPQGAVYEAEDAPEELDNI